MRERGSVFHANHASGNCGARLGSKGDLVCIVLGGGRLTAGGDLLAKRSKGLSKNGTYYKGSALRSSAYGIRHEIFLRS